MWFNKSICFYDVYVLPQEEVPSESAIYLKSGFSFWAAIFSFFWFFYHKCWLMGVFWLVMISCLTMLTLQGVLAYELNVVLRIGIFVLIGFNAHDWYGSALLDRGYRHYSIVTNDGLLGVQKQFLSDYSDVIKSAVD